VLPAAGTYYARVTGVDDTIQLYELSLSVDVLLPGDFNFDGTVDAGDYDVWRKDGGTLEKFNIWRANFGNTAGGGNVLASGLPSGGAVPESGSMVFLIVLGGMAAATWAARGTRRVGRRAGG
jgi:hypothetical protein